MCVCVVYDPLSARHSNLTRKAAQAPTDPGWTRGQDGRFERTFGTGRRTIESLPRLSLRPRAKW